MIALQIQDIKNFMSKLLLSPTFDNFLLVEGRITTFNSFRIDGRLHKDFFTADEAEEKTLDTREFSLWKEVKPFCLELIKGKKTPLFFKLVLHLNPANVGKLLAAGGCSIPTEQIKALVLTIKYDGTHAVLTTGTAFHTFVMSKEPDEIWDKAMLQFLLRKEIPYERM